MTKVQNQAELLENQLQTMTSDRNELAIQSENHFKELQSMEIKLKELTEKDQSDELKREMECLSDEKKQLTIQVYLDLILAKERFRIDFSIRNKRSKSSR